MIPRELFMDMYLNGREDISTYVRQTDPVTAKYGTDDEQSDPASFLTATLDNTDGRFVRDNPMGPYYGKLRPNVEVRWGFWLARDTMSRTVSNGWGTMTSLDVWSILGTASNFAVTPSGATHSIPTAGTFLESYSGTVKQNAYQKIDYTPPFSDVTGGALEPANLIFRRVDALNMYLVRVSVNTAEQYTVDVIKRTTAIDVFIDPNFVTYVVPGLTHMAGQKVSIAAAIEGITIFVKIWLASDPEPAAWQVSLMDTGQGGPPIRQPGQFGVRSGVASGNTNAKPIVFTYSGYEAKDIRAAGELSDLAPEWDETHEIKVARLRADGILRRLRQNNPPAKSTLRRGIDNASNVVAYWHCEDGPGAKSLSSGIPNGTPMAFSSTPALATDSTFACSQALPTFRGGRWTGSVQPYTSSGHVTFQFLVLVPSTGSDDNSVIGSVYLNGSLWYADIRYHTASNGSLSLKLYNRANTNVYDSGPIGFAMNGQPSRVQLNLNNNGADITTTIAVYQPLIQNFTGYFAGSATAVQIGSAEGVYMNANNLNNEVVCGHVTVYNADVDILTLLDETDAYDGEQAVYRFPRLCAENNIPYVRHAETRLIFLGDQYEMGPQRPDALLKLLTDCVTTAQAVLYESHYTVALGMRSLESMYTQEAIMELDYSAELVAPPLTPAPDDLGLINDVVAERSEGGEARATQVTGPRNVNDPREDVAGVGRYEGKVDVNTYRADVLQNIADATLLRGITTETRYPSISLELASDPMSEQQAFEALDVGMGDRVTVSNLSAADIYMPIDQLVIGSLETLVNSEIHKITFNAVPASPFNVLILNNADARVDGDVFLAEDLDTTEPSVDVQPSYGRMTTAAGDHPYQILVNGELMTVTATSGAGPVYTLTVARSVNLVVRTHLTGDAVLLYPTNYLGR